MEKERRDEFYVRGVFISLTVDIERLMDNIIGFHLSCNNSDGWYDYLQFIASTITFANKIQVFKNILESRYPQTYNNYKDSIDFQFKKLRNRRNDVAHSVIGYHVDKQGKIYYDKIAITRIVDFKEHRDTILINEMDEEFNYYRSQLQKLQELSREIIEQ